MRIQTKIAAVGISFTAVTASMVVGILLFRQAAVHREIDGLGAQVTHINEVVSTDAGDRLKAELVKTNELSQRLFDLSTKNDERRLRESLPIAREQMESLGPIEFNGLYSGETVEWQAINQFTKEARTLNLPQMLAGTTWFEPNTDPKVPSPVVDFVRHNAGTYCTIFQRANEAGDMLRVCTSVLDAKGARATGTYIPVRNPDGSENPVLQKVLKGETYFGRAFVVSEWHEAAYEPLWDADHKKVVGMIYVGASTTKSDEALRGDLAKVTVGKSGHMFILGTKAQERGVLLLSPGGKRDGENVWESRGQDGSPIFQEIIRQASAAREGDSVLVRLAWAEPGESASRARLAMVTYDPHRSWVFGSVVDEEELISVQKKLDSSMASVLTTIGLTSAAMTEAVRWAIGVAIALIVVSVAVGLWVGRGICRSLAETIGVLESVAEGDLRHHLDASAHDETGRMADALNRALDGMSETLDAIGKNAGALASSSKSLTAVSESLRGSATQTSSQATVAAAACEQVSTNLGTLAGGAEEMTASIQELARNSGQTVKLASEAVTITEAAGNTIAQLGRSTAEISSVAALINSIAEQTNLLALNATIEAARAGEAGKGFAVVANEVKELAKATASATEEIESRITGVNADMKNAVAAIANIGATIEKLSELQNSNATAVEEQSATTNEMSRNVSEAAKGSHEAAQSIGVVAHAATDTSTAAAETLQAAQQLSELSAELRDRLSRFKTFACENSAPLSRPDSDDEGRFEPPVRRGTKPAPVAH